MHVEVQNQFDARFPERMYVYSYRIYDRYRRHAYSLAVLGDESATWQPTQLEAELWDNLHIMRYSVVKLNDYRLQWEVLEQSTNPFAAVVMAHLKTQETRHDPQARYTWKLSFIRRLYHAGYKRKQIEQLLTLIDWFMELPDALEDTLKAEVRKDEERDQMTYITSWERSGIKKGRKQGWKKGWKKGQKKGLQAAIELGLDLNYGAEGLALMPLAKEITDPDRLLPIYDALKHRKSLEDVRQLILAFSGATNGSD
ncbi:MAG: cytosolic protein [Anaerolineales bacterium]|nr:cytosolic protein [Anaerolineales bacterium]